VTFVWEDFENSALLRLTGGKGFCYSGACDQLSVFMHANPYRKELKEKGFT